MHGSGHSILPSLTCGRVMLTFWTLPVLNGSNGLGATLSLCCASELYTLAGDAL